jgi:hypothetical protein
MLLRGMNMYSILILPSITDLHIGFRTRRVTFLVHVFARGKYAYWSKKRLSELMPALNVQLITNATPNPLTARNQNGKLIPPNFIGTFPKYDGILSKVYLERKQKNMELMIDEIDAFVRKQIEKEKDEDAPAKPKAREVRRQKIIEMLKENKKLSKDDIVDELNISSATAYNEIREARKWMKKEQNMEL